MFAGKVAKQRNCIDLEGGGGGKLLNVTETIKYLQS